MVTSVSIDACYDVVRLENISKSSFNHSASLTSFNDDAITKTVCT